MLDRWLADALLLLHGAFIAFAALGALAVRRWPALAWLHLPAVAWGAYVVLAGRICPLTPLENLLRERAGQGTVGASFIQHYLVPLVYPQAVQGEMGRGLQIGLGLALLALNAAIYGWMLRARGQR